MTTAWVIRSVSGWPKRLAFTLTVDTEAPAIVEAIEEAADRNGIVLERVEFATTTWRAPLEPDEETTI